MHTYYFLFGQSPELSLAELKAVLGDDVVVKESTTFGVLAELAETVDLEKLIFELGGTVKIAEIWEKADHLTTDEVSQKFVSYLAEQDDKKIQFAASTLGRDHLDPIDPIFIKKELQSFGKKARFRRSGRLGVSSAVNVHEDMIELMAIQETDSLYLVRTVVAQPVEHWILRDRRKPYVDSKKGMLPPKLARMLVNIGLEGRERNAETVLYDPFCGSGTVLMEALLGDVSVLGSDQDEESVYGSIENIRWMDEYYEYPGHYNVFRADVTNVSKAQLPSLPQVIVTEPFLGKPSPKPTFVPKMMKGLYKLYLGAFKTWAKFLEPGATVLFIFPQVTVEGHTFDFKDLIDKLAEFGYTTDLEPLEYGRPDAIVKRQIVRFRFKG